MQLIITENVYNKIMYTCQQINKTEWSGILLYEDQDLNKPLKDKKLEIKDIILCDIGSASHTTFQHNEKINNEYKDKFVDYVIENPTALNFRMGSIHSHNSMGVFFSPTDVNDLGVVSKSYDYYISLVVNNFGEFLGKCAVSVFSENKIVKNFYHIVNGKHVFSHAKDEIVNDYQLRVLDLEIISPEKSFIIEENYKNEIKEMIQAKKNAVSLKSKNYKFNPTNNNFVKNNNTYLNNYVPNQGIANYEEDSQADFDAFGDPLFDRYNY